MGHRLGYRLGHSWVIGWVIGVVLYGTRASVGLELKLGCGLQIKRFFPGIGFVMNSLGASAWGCGDATAGK